MSSFQATIRDGLQDKINEVKDQFIISDFSVGSTYFPKSTLENVGDRPELWLVAMGISSSRERILRDTSKLELVIPIQVALQKRVDPTDTNSIDVLVELAEQVMDVGEDDELVTGQDYQWRETTPLYDENGLIYSYEQLTVGNVFQTIWTFQYTHIKQQKLIS